MNDEKKHETMSTWLSAQEKLRKRFAAGFSAVMVCVVLSPVQENYMVGITAQGERVVIPYNYAGSGGFNQVRRQINRRVSSGKAEKLCEKVSKRLARSIARTGNHPLADVVTIQIMTGRYRFDEYFTGNKAPLKEKVRCSCPVSRREKS